MTLEIWRDSVCAGDDVTAPNAVRIDLPEDATIGDVLERLLGTSYLASISGGKATWVFEGDFPLAVVAQQWDAPSYLVSREILARAMAARGKSYAFNFRYLAQKDPGQVLSELAPEK